MNMPQLALQIVFAASAAFAVNGDRVSPAIALSEVKSGKAIVLDVRETDELKAGQVQGAQNFPSSKVGGQEWKVLVQSLPKDKEIYTYCAKGGRADKVSESLRTLGYKSVSTGGYQDWVAAGAKSK